MVDGMILHSISLEWKQFIQCVETFEVFLEIIVT